MSWLEKLFDNLYIKMSDENLWVEIGTSALKIIVILLLAYIIRRIGRIAIQNLFKARVKGPLLITERRETTLIKLLENVLSYVIYFVVIMMILETIGIPIRTLLAGAGILGLAIGFGAQNLVRDIITGFFIILEDQFSVGDYVRIGTFEGTVQEIGLRTTKIKSFTGELNILPNGSIIEVTNFSLHNSVAVVDINIPYESDMNKVEQLISDLLATLPGKYEDMVKPPELLGVQNFGASEVVLRVTCEVVPMRHWYIARMLRKDIRQVLSENGIDLPLPRVVMYNRKGEESSGKREGERG